MSEDKPKGPDFRARVAEEMIRQIEAGTAPWMKPWQPGTIRTAPYNPTTGNAYRGMNALWLEMMGRGDPRWMTYRQAKAEGAQVRGGEKGTSVEYWQFSETTLMKDADGKPLLDEEGQKRYQTAVLERPKVFHAVVFNGEQIDGLAPLPQPELKFQPVEEAEKVLAQGGIDIRHDQPDRAFYRPGTDRIHLPPKGAFKEGYEYYATALHELGHATGHPSRLARDMSGGFGSPSYAKEELRAEIASYMVTTELGLGHYPERHAGYVESWLKALQDDRNEIFRAARDADRMASWMLEPEKRPELERAAQAARKAEQAAEQSETKERAMEPVERTAAATTASGAVQQEAKPRTYLDVPYAQKDEAKAAGARWDRREKAWYIPEGAEAQKLARWAKKDEAKAIVPERDPRGEFADALKANGLLLKDAPVMDGKWHRVPVEGDGKGKESGSYRGFLDGVPNGTIQNFKSGGEPVKWVATGNAPADLDRAKLAAEAQDRAAEREKELRLQHKATAKRAYGIFVNAGDAAPDHPYLAKKGVEAHGLKQDEKGNLLVPLQDAKGFLWNVQSISPDGEKRFLNDGRKNGLMHGLNEGKLDLKQAKTIIVAEGYATAASLHSATGIPAVVAFDAGNLKPVAEAIRKQNPQADIVIAADDDHKLEAHPVIKRNVGRDKAEEAAQAVGGRTISPPLNQAEKDKGLSDFNDLEASRGKKAFQRLVGELLEKGRPMQRQKATGQTRENALAL